MNQMQVPIKKVCPACQGHGYLDTGQTFTLLGRVHPQLAECFACQKKGFLIEWIDVHQFSMMLHAIAAEEQAQ